MTLASGADPARRLERALWKPTADGPALPAVRQPGPGRQVTWTTGREGGQKGPSRGGAVTGLGAAGWGLSEGRTLEQLRPRDTGRGAWGKSESTLPDQGLTGPQKGQWVALADERECARRRGFWVASCASALFLPVTQSESIPFPCVNERTGSFLMCVHMEGYSVSTHPSGP